MKLKIFTDKSSLRRNTPHVPLLCPFWGECDSIAGNIDYGRFEEMRRVGATYFSIVPIEQAHGVVLPSEWPAGGKYPEARKLADQAAKYGKPIIVFFNNDSSEDIRLRNSLVFRTSFYSSTRKVNEFALPGWSLDFLKAYLDDQLVIRRKREVPIVGYTGYTDYHNLPTFLRGYVRRFVYSGEPNPGRLLRGQAVRILARCKSVGASFIIRDSRMLGYSSESRRREYVQNIVDSDYSLVVRGRGNFSYRLYEILSCGRMPIFVNTDCVLPFDHLIDWKKYMIWIEADDIDSIADRIADYHSAISDNAFVEMQYECRQLYEEWIRPAGFYSNIWRCLPQL
jgi:hypothetical protein